MGRGGSQPPGGVGKGGFHVCIDLKHQFIAYGGDTDGWNFPISWESSNTKRPEKLMSFLPKLEEDPCCLCGCEVPAGMKCHHVIFPGTQR